MNKKISFVTLILFVGCAATAQKLKVSVKYVTADAAAGNNTVYYVPGQSLSWDDFKAKPVTNSDAAALSNAGFGIKLAFHRLGDASELMISVNCNFSKNNSWVKEGNKTAYILNHEQKHFDIAYISTLLFIKKLQNASLTNANYVSVIEKIYNESVLIMAKMQDEYDSETSHSRVPEKQAEWNEKINKQLSLYAKQ